MADTETAESRGAHVPLPWSSSWSFKYFFPIPAQTFSILQAKKTVTL